MDKRTLPNAAFADAFSRRFPHHDSDGNVMMMHVRSGLIVGMRNLQGSIAKGFGRWALDDFASARRELDAMEHLWKHLWDYRLGEGKP